MNEQFYSILEIIQLNDLRYKADAYVFVMEALQYTQKKIQIRRHVTSSEILQGMKDLLINNYGPMTMTVLHHWGINSTEDFGNVVFNLVENRILSKTDDDSLEQFRNVYDFTEVFDHGYRQQLAKKVSRLR